MGRLQKTEANLSGRPVDGWSVIRRTVPYLWPKGETEVRVRVVASLALILFYKLISVATPLVYKYAVDTLSGEAPSTGLLVGWGAIGLTIAYGIARLSTSGFQQLRDVVFVKVGQRALRLLALETFEHIHRLSLRYHITRKTGGLSRIIERGVKGVDFLLRFVLFSIGPLVLELLMISVVLFVLFDAWFLVVVGVVVALYTAFTFKVTEWRVKIRKVMNDQDTDANQKAVDSLLNFETVKYFGAEGREAARYDGAMRAYADAAVTTGQSLAFLNFGQSLIITSGLISVMVLAAIGVQQGTMTVGDFVAVNAYMLQITMPLNFLGTVYREIRQALIDMADMFGLLDQPPEVEDAPSAPALAVRQGRVAFENVSFGYGDGRQILKGVSFEVPAGETLAIVGATGAGKSTIGRLLFRFYDVTGGRITIDGQDIRSVSQESLHAAIGVVPQDTVLFNDSIRYNIAYGREGARQEDIETVARAASIHRFIASLPQGYETQVGERGLKLSGGEKQRVGIARTLLKNPPILLLDEATSALDTGTEREIQGELKAMGRGRTVITIAHRLSTIADADRIIVLDAGEIAESGRHAELLSENGLYAALWTRQAEDQGTLAAE
ncbi:ABC transporter ATP-binding protein/permease [Pseudoroseicyclus sp. CXY001]|uniref:ABCB family ABC transporter ATP-binding protein/permease n=1 Tax=Pseudoroseicyclus sp. CXY001 TaxID=3242492 RepID=UPI00358DAE8B